MIKSIEITNFQSHKASKLELSPMVTIIQGNSDCGKSAVMRALNWLLFNPAGDYFISDWARKGKTISSPCMVSVEANGHHVTRRRDKDFNGYELDGEAFEATRNSVPPKVADALGLGEVNVQRQLDPPFLLSMSAGEVSRYINSLVNLERIDRWTTAMKGREGALRSKLEAERARLERSKAEFDSYSFVPRLEELSADVNLLDGKISECEKTASEIKCSMEERARINNELSEMPNAELAIEKLSEAEKVSDGISSSILECGALRRELSDRGLLEGKISELPNIEAAFKALEAVGKISDKIREKENGLISLSSELNKWRSVKVPKLDEKIFEILETLERWGRIMANLEANAMQLRQELGTFSSNSCRLEYLGKELGPLLEKLDGMVCPMCGRSGVHTHGEGK